MRIITRAIGLDIFIVALYFVTVNGMNKLSGTVSNTLFLVLMFGVWGLYLASLFLNNSKLFFWMNNFYSWSISTTIVTMTIFLPTVIYSVHL